MACMCFVVQVPDQNYVDCHRSIQKKALFYENPDLFPMGLRSMSSISPSRVLVSEVSRWSDCMSEYMSTSSVRSKDPPPVRVSSKSSRWQRFFFGKPSPVLSYSPQQYYAYHLPQLGGYHRSQKSFVYDFNKIILPVTRSIGEGKLWSPWNTPHRFYSFTCGVKPYYSRIPGGSRHRLMGSLAGAVHLLNNNAGDIRGAHGKHKSLTPAMLKRCGFIPTHAWTLHMIGSSIVDLFEGSIEFREQMEQNSKSLFCGSRSALKLRDYFLI